ncbi:hypothetical protein ES754_08815 [Psychrobacter frigidicola]|uniref:Uncharacterized protein n=1 Tax=Psychrobacter frigidicola TaxID=45611 RepID=A0A5C7A8N0_9GAMM|nr:hypothetical protein [Psychrobacter frigidicola]TXD97100.1 hypothetical protein ES754_08815 [Psychrobacter frigidicola]
MLAMLILAFFMPVLALIHLIATVCFYKKGYYRSQSFTIKHLAVALFFPIAGMALITFEYWDNMPLASIHVGSFLSILFVYAFLAILFAIPYLLHVMAAEK